MFVMENMEESLGGISGEGIHCLSPEPEDMSGQRRISLASLSTIHSK